MSDAMSGDRRPLLINVSTVMMVLAFVAVLLRFVCRRWTRAPLLIDDWLILAALPFAWVQAIMVIWMVKKHHYGLHASQLVEGDARGFFQGLYIYEIAYPIDIALIKFSFLAFTWRVFRIKPMKLPVIITTALVAIWFIAIVLIAIFPCHPIHGFWNFGIGSKCINYLRFYVAQSVYSIITDLMILFLPMPFVWKLHVSWGRRFGITCIFCVGIFLVLVSVIRMTLLVKNSNSKDFSWDLVYIGLWTLIEVHAGVVCACLPSMRPLVRLILYGSFTATSKPSNQQENSASVQGGRSRGRSEYGDGHRNSTLSRPYHKPEFQTQIRSLPHDGMTATNERRAPRLSSQINVREEIAIDIVELGHLRFANQDQHDRYDEENVSEKGLLR